MPHEAPPPALPQEASPEAAPRRGCLLHRRLLRDPIVSLPRSWKYAPHFPSALSPFDPRDSPGTRPDRSRRSQRAELWATPCVRIPQNLVLGDYFNRERTRLEGGPPVYTVATRWLGCGLEATRSAHRHTIGAPLLLQRALSLAYSCYPDALLRSQVAPSYCDRALCHARPDPLRGTLGRAGWSGWVLGRMGSKPQYRLQNLVRVTA